jgi:hypothetical protein
VAIEASCVGPSAVDNNLKIAVFALPSASKFTLVARVKAPFKFSLLCTLTPGLAVEFVTEILLKVVAVEVLMVCVVPFAPENTTVPLLCVNDPLVMLKFPLMSKFVDGAVKEVPATVKLPFTVIFPVPPVKVPPEKVASLFTVMAFAPCVIVPENPELTVKLKADRSESSTQLELLAASKTTTSPVTGTPAFPVPPEFAAQLAARFELELEGATQ